MSIDDYFIRLEKEIAKCIFIAQKEIDYSRRTDYLGYARGRLTFIDGSLLYFKEYVDVRKEDPRLRYSYHYEKDAKLLFRYDNAHDYLQIISSPHHKHVNEKRVINVRSIPNMKAILSDVTTRILDQTKFKRG